MRLQVVSILLSFTLLAIFCRLSNAFEQNGLLLNHNGENEPEKRNDESVIVKDGLLKVEQDNIKRNEEIKVVNNLPFSKRLYHYPKPVPGPGGVIPVKRK